MAVSQQHFLSFCDVKSDILMKFPVLWITGNFFQTNREMFPRNRYSGIRWRVQKQNASTSISSDASDKFLKRYHHNHVLSISVRAMSLLFWNESAARQSAQFVLSRQRDLNDIV